MAVKPAVKRAREDSDDEDVILVGSTTKTKLAVKQPKKSKVVGEFWPSYTCLPYLRIGSLRR
jgi:hypothetical protein